MQIIYARQDERRRKMLAGTAIEKADKREAKRLKGLGVARTKSFRSPQSFGPASAVRSVSVEEYLQSSEIPQKSEHGQGQS